MITLEEVFVLAALSLVLVLFALFTLLFIYIDFSKHLDEHKKSKKKAEEEKHDLELLNKTRELVFDDLCNYFNSVKGENHEI